MTKSKETIVVCPECQNEFKTTKKEIKDMTAQCPKCSTYVFDDVE